MPEGNSYTRQTENIKIKANKKNYVSRAEMIGDGLVDKELVAQT